MSFTWIPIYSEIARKVLAFESRQEELLDLLREMRSEGMKVILLNDRDAEGTRIALEEIDPFTFFASFNRTSSVSGRQAMLAKIKGAWDLSSAVPDDFDGIPLANAQNSWSFGYRDGRGEGDVGLLWRVAKAAIGASWRSFDWGLFDQALGIRQMGFAKLTTSLFWVEPRGFLPGDKHTEAYFRQRGVVLSSRTGAGYAAWLDAVESKAGSDFPQFSWDAYLESGVEEGLEGGDDPISTGLNEGEAGAVPFTRADALSDLFMSVEALDGVLARLRRKKALILQGPPGVGKTFVARRLAFALMGERDERRVATVQFHPSYGYEDFVQGFRPSRTGLERRDGVLHQFARLARNDPSRDWFFIIDEINRGNLAKIFGELLMLIESDKRGPEHAIPLTYSEGPEEKFFLPKNLYFIGTMNTADRSLAMVDYALRRRFAFVTVEPAVDSPEFAGWMKKRGASEALIARIRRNVGELNAVIEKERDLGPGFRVGHSFFCPQEGDRPDELWYREVIAGEIQPLLEEYFDSGDRVRKLVADLLGD